MNNIFLALVAFACFAESLPAQDDFKTWHDRSGGFSINAKLLSVNHLYANLLTEDGRKIQVSLRKLAEADRKHCEEVLAERKSASKQDVLFATLEAFREQMDALQKSQVNSVVREEERRKHWRDFVDELEGKRLSCRFTVVDVGDDRTGLAGSRGAIRQAIPEDYVAVSVEKCSLEASAAPVMLIIPKMPALIRQLSPGSVIEADGVMFQNSAKTAFKWRLDFESPSSRPGYTTTIPVTIYGDSLRVVDNTQPPKQAGGGDPE